MHKALKHVVQNIRGYSLRDISEQIFFLKYIDEIFHWKLGYWDIYIVYVNVDWLNSFLRFINILCVI